MQEERVLTYIYKKLDFHNLIEPVHDIVHPAKPKYTEVKDVDDFLKKSTGYGAIIYTTSERSGEMEAAVKIRDLSREKPRNVIEDPDDHEIYRAMENKVAILTREQSIRGYDFKLSEAFKDSEVFDPAKGIDILLAERLPNKRAYIQAGGRVGRFNERAGYYILDSIAR